MPEQCLHRTSSAIRIIQILAFATAITVAWVASNLEALASSRESVIHNFDGGGGRAPQLAALSAAFDEAGRLICIFGTTPYGGSADAGVLFKITPDGNEEVLHSFGATESDGVVPLAGVVSDNIGNLYGTTWSGGQNDNGVVYKIAPDGTETLLHVFAGGEDGGAPYSTLVIDAKGNLLGTTSRGGRRNEGTIFKIAPTGQETILHSFSGWDGAGPTNISLDDKGAIYGVTGGDQGVIYKRTNLRVIEILHRFGGAGDGNYAFGGLVRDVQGNLFGGTQFGGASGNGMIFEFGADGTYKILHSFTGTDGSGSVGALALDGDGTIYGTTRYGGKLNQGAVFSLSPGGQETVLHSFGAGGDGSEPMSGVVIDHDHYLYSATSAGGSGNLGIIFSLKK